MGEHHPAAVDTDAEPDTYSYPFAVCITERFRYPGRVVRWLAGSIARADVRVPVALTKRFAVSSSIAQADAEFFRERDPVAESITVRKILSFAQNEG